MPFWLTKDGLKCIDHWQIWVKTSKNELKCSYYRLVIPLTHQLLAKSNTCSYPNATAEASASPKAADFPRPRAAVRVTVLLNVFSDIASTNLSTALAWIEINQKESQLTPDW